MIVGKILIAPEAELCLDAETPLDLPCEATALAIRCQGNSHELLVVVPPGVDVVVNGRVESPAARIWHGSDFHLRTQDAMLKARFEALAPLQISAQIGARRCTTCKSPLGPRDSVRVCAGCGAVLCALCVAEQCIRCAEPLRWVP